MLSHHLLLGVLEALRDVIEGLVLCDGVLRHPSLLRLEVPELRLPGQTPLQLPEGGQEPGPVGLKLPVLPRDAELDGEPVAGGQLLYVVIRGAERGQTDLLTELGKGGVSEQGHVTQELVTDILNSDNESLGSLGSLGQGNVTGSGVYMGVLWCRMYWVEWNTLKARPARKSREERRPATGRSWNPVTP